MYIWKQSYFNLKNKVENRSTEFDSQWTSISGCIALQTPTQHLAYFVL